MKVYLEVGNNSRGLLRVRDALVRYAPPSIQVVHRSQDADLDIIHVYGRHDAIERRINKLRANNKPYAMIQYCLRSTMNPSTNDWLGMWLDAKAVWSYYDLNQLAIEDQNKDGNRFYRTFYQYHAPLGVDSEFINSIWEGKRKYVILASSQHALSEGARECAFAAKRVGKPMFFLGHELRRGPDIVCKTNLTDLELSDAYSQCRYVSGLRRVEGFELPVIEGALCGAVPIVYDRPEMRKWFNDFAIFIKEGSRQEVIDQLAELFQRTPSPINTDMRYVIQQRFNWQTIIRGFYDRIL